MIKRMLDLVLASLALLIIWPLMALIAMIIWASSKGPIVFVQQRAGQGGRPFRMFKFRTMRMDVDPYGPSPREGSDPRLTRFGRWLRETSLDELPQLLNVLKGDMSLVGPRPLYVSQMGEWDGVQRQRLRVKPGLTGLAQTLGRGDLTREAKLALDVTYVQNQSLILDLRLLARTFRQVCTRRAIYERQYSQTEQIRQKGESMPPGNTQTPACPPHEF